MTIAVKLKMETNGDEEEYAEFLRVSRHLHIDSCPYENVVAEMLHDGKRKVEE